MKILVLAFLFALTLATQAHAAVALTFNDTSGIEEGFMVLVTKPDGTYRVDLVLPSPGATSVTLTFPDDGVGDCFQVSAYGQGGTSPWTNRVCVGKEVPRAPNAPTSPTAVLKP